MIENLPTLKDRILEVVIELMDNTPSNRVVWIDGNNLIPRGFENFSSDKLSMILKFIAEEQPNVLINKGVNQNTGLLLFAPGAFIKEFINNGGFVKIDEEQ